MFVSQTVLVIVQINLYKFTKLGVIYIMIFSTLKVNVLITAYIYVLMSCGNQRHSEEST